MEGKLDKTSKSTYCIMELRVFKAEINPDIKSDLEVFAMSLVKNPAIERNFLHFDSQKKVGLKFDAERRIVSGVAMVADMPIYRNTPELGEFYVVFDKYTIAAIVKKFAQKGLMNSFTLAHDEANKISNITIFNSFVSDASLGVLPMKGYEDIADGSWFISAKVEDDSVWQKVKNGEVKGFSVEGAFEFNLVNTIQLTAQQAFEAIKEILAKTI